MLAVLLALLSAALFGAMTVALSFGFRSTASDPSAGALITATVAALLAGAAAAVDRGGGLSGRDVAFFALAGLIAPGASQLLFTRAVRDAGPSRTSVVVGTAPLFAAAIAIGVLAEPVKLPLTVGGLLVVVAGLLLVSDPGRPEHVRLSGIASPFSRRSCSPVATTSSAGTPVRPRAGRSARRRWQWRPARPERSFFSSRPGGGPWPSTFAVSTGDRSPSRASSSGSLTSACSPRTTARA